MRLSTADLRIFAAIAETGGITAAAAKLGLGKSRVSRDLSALEDRLGSRLVQRTTRRLSLTDTGELLAGYARRVVEEMDNAEAAIDAMREAPRGELKVSIPFSILRYVLAPRLRAFRSAYPEVRLAIDASMRIVDLVEEGVDVAIRIGELASSSLVARRLATIPQIFVASRGYVERKGAPQSPLDLAEHEVINLGRDVGPRVWRLASEHKAPVDVAVRPVIAVHDPGVVLDLVTQGVGIAPAPSLYARTSMASGEIVQVLPDYRFGLAPIHAVFPSRRILAPKVRAFVDFAAEAFEAAERGADQLTGSGPR